jgi:hypothetical protein
MVWIGSKGRLDAFSKINLVAMNVSDRQPIKDSPPCQHHKDYSYVYFI